MKTHGVRSMTRGCRKGLVTKSELVIRLQSYAARNGLHLPSPRQQKLPCLLGHALYHQLVTKHEFVETVPRDVTTVPCYLHTHMTDGTARRALESYVQAASALYRRGSLIANCMAMTLYGPRLQAAEDVNTPRPRYDEHDESTAATRMLELASEDDVRASPFKHIFLPERWPSRQAPRCQLVDDVLNGPFADVLPSAPVGYQNVMTSSGWDNAINRMATKYSANIQVHARANLMKAIVAYIRAAPLRPGTPADLLSDTVQKRPRPLSVHDDDWYMAMDLRSHFVPSDDSTWYPAKNPPFTTDVLRLHFFLTRYGVDQRSYLPVVSRGRKYCYVDAKIARRLLVAARKKSKVCKPSKSSDKPSTSSGKPASNSIGDDGGGDDDDVDDEPEEQSESVGDVLGITADGFNRARRKLRQTLRRRYYKDRKTATEGDRRRRARKLEAKWARMDETKGKLPETARFDSLETDGVGLRLCIKSPIDMRPFTMPLPAQPAEQSSDVGKKRRKATKKPILAETEFQAVDASDRSQPLPTMVAIDTGRAKPFAAAISRSPTRKPATEVFTRRQYYYEMHHALRMKWEADRLHRRPDVVQALATLAETGGVHNCEPASWAAYLTAETPLRTMLNEEFVADVERARWRMRTFRRKKSSLDRAVGRVITAATKGMGVERPMVFVVGNATFGPTGPGELPVPTSSLSIAFRRGIQWERRRGRKVVVFSPDEFHTTMCCCGCGEVTSQPTVRRRRTRGEEPEEGPSRRLRLCTRCDPVGKLRDRDVQAARNILWLGFALYYGLDRPSYMTRPSRGGAVPT